MPKARKYPIDFSPEEPPVVGQRVNFSRRVFGVVVSVNPNWTRKTGPNKGKPMRRIEWEVFERREGGDPVLRNRAVSPFRAAWPVKTGDDFRSVRTYAIDYDPADLPPIGTVVRHRFYDAALHEAQTAAGEVDGKGRLTGRKAKAGMRNGEATLTGVETRKNSAGRITTLMRWLRDDGVEGVSGAKSRDIQWTKGAPRLVGEPAARVDLARLPYDREAHRLSDSVQLVATGYLPVHLTGGRRTFRVQWVDQRGAPYVSGAKGIPEPGRLDGAPLPLPRNPDIPAW